MPESAKRVPLEKATTSPEQPFAETAPSGAIGLPSRVEEAGEQSIGRLRTVVRAGALLSRAAQRLWPAKPAHHLAFHTGASLRAAEYWIAGEREMSAEAFAALLRSDDGFAFLEAVMNAVPAPSRPAWWRRLSRTASRAEIRRRQAALAAEIDALEREEQLDLELRLAGPRGSGR